MKFSSVQVSYISAQELAANFLAHRQTVELTKLPGDILVPGPDGTEQAMFRLSEKNQDIIAEGMNGNTLQFKEGEPQNQAVLRPSLEWRTGDMVFRFTVRYPSVGQSAWSRRMIRFVAAMVILFSILEVWLIFWMHSSLMATDVWESSYSKLEILSTVDLLRLRASRLKPKTPLQRALAKEIQEEFAKRVSYLRLYDNSMRRSQRRRMLEECQRLEKILTALEQSKDFGVERPLDLDGAVRAIVGR